jgi:hypothetical protein
MALNAKEGQEMIDACIKANVKLLVGYRMHFEPKTLEIINMRKEGEFGKVMFFQGLCGFKIGDPTQWRLNKQLAGGGSLMDIGIYAINGARYMVGEEPVWVTAQEAKTNPEKFKEGVDETTLRRWKKKPAFKLEWERRVGELQQSPERTQKLLDNLYERALAGDNNSAKLYLQATNRLAPTQVHVEHSSKPSEISDAELDSLIASVAQSEVESRKELKAQ